MKRVLFFLAPDGAGGGGDPPGDTPLGDWIKRLNETEKKGRGAVVEELAKALGVKPGEAVKKLKEAGWDPKTADGRPDSSAGGNPPPKPKAETFSVTLRHKTPYPRYRRAGIVLTNQFIPYAVTEEQRAALERDTWVEFQKNTEPGIA
ncbi:MAG: hypothetical protein LBJ24_02370 [Treponema sp.]|jgi:hypothetical protein|nr:hypothetical protein [Treponema sp.]